MLDYIDVSVKVKMSQFNGLGNKPFSKQTFDLLQSNMGSPAWLGKIRGQLVYKQHHPLWGGA